MDSMMLKPLCPNTFILRRPKVANFTEIIKTATMFINHIKVNKLETMHQNAICICMS